MQEEKGRAGRRRETRAHFFVPPAVDEILKEFDRATVSLAPEYQAAASGFRHSLVSTLSTVSMPFRLAVASMQDQHFQRIHIAERIRAGNIQEDALNPGEDLEAVREREALNKAHSQMQKFAKSEDGKDAMTRDTCEFLLGSLARGLEGAAHELLGQGLVLLWSAFEVFCRDAFEALLNREPQKVKVLVGHPTTRKRFEAERLPLETLAQHGFDLSSHLGTVLVRQQDFSDLPTVKAVYAVLYPNSRELHEALGHSDLWTLYQRRHLVVHRRGIIDQAYLDATGDTSAVGAALVVIPADVERALLVVVSVGTKLARALSATNAP